MLPVVLLLIHCLLLLSLFVEVLYLVLVLLFIILCPSSFVIILMGKPCDSKYAVALITVLMVSLQCAIVVFSDHSHLLFQILNLVQMVI